MYQYIFLTLPRNIAITIDDIPYGCEKEILNLSIKYDIKVTYV